jgi:hypothetical protein
MPHDILVDGRLVAGGVGAKRTERMAKAFVAVGATLLLLAACGCSREIGTKFEPSLADRLVPGSSTLGDAVRLLGKPFKTRDTLRGITWAEWWYLKDHSQRTESQDLVALFAANGTLLSIVRRHDCRP